MHPAARVALIVVAGWLAGCATPPAAVAPPPRAGPAASAGLARDEFEQRLRARVRTVSAQGRWTEAALQLELLATLRPDDAALAEQLAEARRRARDAAAEQAARAAQATQHADPDTATRRWLGVLAIDPTDVSAAAALRQLEADRNRRTTLGRHAASAFARKALAEIATPPPAAPFARPDRARTAALATDREVDPAIDPLDQRLASEPHDAAARRLPTDAHRNAGETPDALGPTPVRGTLVGKRQRVDPERATPVRRLRGPRPTHPIPASTPEAAARGGGIRPADRFGGPLTGDRKPTGPSTTSSGTSPSSPPPT